MSEPESQLQTPNQPKDITPPQFKEVPPAQQVGNNSEEEDSVLDRLLGSDDPAPRQDTRTAAPSAPDADFDRALKALQRDGVPAEIIESIKSDPSKVKEWGLKAAKRQADVDAFGAAKGNAKKPDAETSAKPKSSSESGDGEADADPLSEFGDIFGDDAAKPLRAMTERLQRDFDQRAKAIEVKYETVTAYQQQAAAYGADAPSIDHITETAAKLGRENPQGYNTIGELVAEAFRRTAGEPKRRDPRDSMRPTAGKAPPRPTREIDREDMALDILLNGGSKVDAIRAITR